MKYKNKITGEEVKFYNEHYYIAPDTACIPKRFIENSNDWEKVEELDYEILEYKEISMRPTGPFKNSEFIIYSVKRLYDGEVFTIGDKISFGHNYNEVITKMSLTDANSNIKKGIWIHYEGGSCHIDIAVKLKTPLFTTEDGVEIFEGNEYWYVVTFDHNIGHEWKPLSHVADWNGNSELMKPPLGGKQFSTKEKAEEYVLLNKPMLSLQDLLNVWGVSDEIGAYKTSLMFNKFEKLAKSKL